MALQGYRIVKSVPHAKSRSRWQWIHPSPHIFLAFGLLGATCAGAATIQVPPNTGYFTGWTFNTMSSPGSGCGSESLPASTVLNGTLGSDPFQMTAEAVPAPEQWQNYPGFFFGGNIPLGTDAPSTVSVVNIRRGNTAYTFTAPLPVGTVYFLHDVDAYEAVNVSFEGCGGNPIDASNFDFLQVSASSATIPSHSIAGLAPASWSVSSAVPGVDGPNELVGIVIQSSNVCVVRNVNTAGAIAEA